MILRAIADEGSLAGASRRLRISPPATTRALIALEDRAGVRLVERTTRKLALTEAGRRLAERARALLSDYQEAVHGDPAAPPRGLLRVTAPIQFGRWHMAPIVSRFLDLYPEVRVELILNDRNLDLIEEGLDVALRIGPLRNSSLVARHVGDVRRIVVASPAYLSRRGEPRAPEELSAHETIFGSLWVGATEWRFGREETPIVVRLNPRLMANDTETVLTAARDGRGVARPLSYQAAPDLKSGALKRLLTRYEPETLPVNLVTASAGLRSARSQAFLDHAAKALRALAVLREGPR